MGHRSLELQNEDPRVARFGSTSAERAFAELKHLIFEKPRLLLRGRSAAGTEMTLAVLACSLKHVLRALGRRGLMESLAVA